jgi:predicted lipoprotein with Yx(FWY)xxD motif
VTVTLWGVVRSVRQGAIVRFGQLGTLLLIAGCCELVFVATAASAPRTAVSVESSHNPALGQILVTVGGRTLYRTSAEPRGVIKCTGTCVTDWLPLVLVKGAKPVAGAGVRPSLLGVIRRPDGRLQVTYAGMALYTYSGDKKAGSVAGQGIGGHGWLGGIWTAVAPSGAVVKASTSAPPAANVGTTPGSPSSSTAPGMNCYA